MNVIKNISKSWCKSRSLDQGAAALCSFHTGHTLESSSLLFDHKILLCFVESLSSLSSAYPSTVCLLVKRLSLPLLTWGVVTVSGHKYQKTETSASRSHRVLFYSPAKESCPAFWLIANYSEANRNANSRLDYLSGRGHVTPTLHIWSLLCWPSHIQYLQAYRLLSVQIMLR